MGSPTVSKDLSIDASVSSPRGKSDSSAWTTCWRPIFIVHVNTNDTTSDLHVQRIVLRNVREVCTLYTIMWCTYWYLLYVGSLNCWRIIADSEMTLNKVAVIDRHWQTLKKGIGLRGHAGKYSSWSNVRRSLLVHIFLVLRNFCLLSLHINDPWLVGRQ